GITGMGLGGIVFTKGIELIPVSVGTAITATSPFIAAALGVLFLGETMRPLQYAGILSILVGVVAVSL
ncbi:MAG TPA: EamA family transporter, partial [Synergistaceae bacterium]|nr:EamA family transporter [Synergistaceae bacterium]